MSNLIFANSNYFTTSTQFHNHQATIHYTTKGVFFRSYQALVAFGNGTARNLFLNKVNYSKTTEKQLSRWLYESGFKTLGTATSRKARFKTGKPFQVENEINGQVFNVYFVSPEHLARAFNGVKW